MFLASLIIALFGCSEREESTQEEDVLVDTVTDRAKNEADSIRNEADVPDTGFSKSASSPSSEYTGLSIGELWSRYKQLRREAEEHKKAGEFDESIEKLLAAARCAILLNRPGIASWQYNNAGKHAIDKFMALTDYRMHIDTLNGMENGPRKLSYLGSIRSRMKAHDQILQQAAGLFEEAKRMNLRAPEKSREKAIAGNEAFIREAVSLIDSTNAVQ